MSTTTLHSDTVLDVIASFCEPMELCKTMQLVCKSWHKAANVEEVWKRCFENLFCKQQPSLLEKRFATPQEEGGKTWKIWYQERYTARKHDTLFPNCKMVANCTVKLVYGFTMNDYDSNKTELNAGHLKIENYAITGEGQYGKGTNYNDAVIGKWSNGAVSQLLQIQVDEVYGTHPAVFIYNGAAVSDYKITGTYRWTQNAAKGKFEWHFK